tara:strand:- start:1472 stop:1699 length:228 start_codon:yes stop_codon:yes gene_type:complete
MTDQDTMVNSNERPESPNGPRLISLGILLGSVVLLHAIVLTTLDVFVPIDDGADSNMALVIDSGMKPMDMLVDAR